MIVNVVSMMNAVNMRHNALNGTFANNDMRMSMISMASRPMIEPLDFRGLAMAESAIEMDNYRNQLMYKVATVQEEAQRKALDKKIKSSFNIFA